MRYTILICFLLTTGFLIAQTNNDKPSSSIRIEMLFPQGKSKALIMSYDDGTISDKRLVKLMNDYGIKGTFHLNSNKLSTKGYVTREEVKSLYTGHEVSVHSANHPGLGDLSKIDITYEVVEDRRALEKLTGITVRGMAYPFGNYNDFVVETVSGLGIEYARTVKDSYDFSIPADFLRWDPSIHQFAKAYFIPNDSVNDKKELASFYKLVGEFIKSEKIALLDVWGHSWENEGAGNKWAEIENFFKLISNRKDIHYTTQIDLVDYINAYRNLKFSVNKNYVYNLSSINLFIKINDQIIEIKAGTTTATF